MEFEFRKSQIALAVLAAVGAAAFTVAPVGASAAKVAGKYVAGDFHNHTTCSDGSISMEKLVKKATDKVDTPWGLDWFVQAGHGNSGGTRNCTLVEDATLSTPAYPYTTGPLGTWNGPSTTWTDSIGNANVKGDTTAGVGYMWRWQSIQEYQYPVMEYLAAYRNLPLFVGLESIVAGHEHSSMTVLNGQMPASLDNATLPTSPGPITARYAPVGPMLPAWRSGTTASISATPTPAAATRPTRTSATTGTASVTGSANAADPLWNTTAQKLVTSGSSNATNAGINGHLKTLEGLKWMVENAPNGSYYVPAHLERAGPFYANGSFGYNVEHLRDFNNTAPNIAFGMETQPGHGASSNRGEYQVKRNNINGVLTDSVGGTTYGGTGVYGAQIGGVWDAMLGEGRNYFFFASSDWHNRGTFGPDDRRSTQDFYPGEYQRTYVMVRNGTDKLRPQTIVNGLRSGNNAFSASGQLIDRLSVIACASYPGPATTHQRGGRSADRRGRGLEQHRRSTAVGQLRERWARSWW